MDYRGGERASATTTTDAAASSSSSSVPAVLQAAHALLTHRAMAAALTRLLSAKQAAELKEKAEAVQALAGRLRQGATPLPPPDPR